MRCTTQSCIVVAMNTDETAKNTEAAPLAWAGKIEWGAASKTHRAEANGWKYAALQPVKGGEWRVQGWGPDGEHRFYREGKTLKQVKALAQDHQGEQVAAAHAAADKLAKAVAAPAPDLLASLAKVATNADKVTAALARLMTRIGQPSRPWTLKACGCPTPTHRMSCGIGARPKVVLPQRTGRMSVRQPELTVIRKDGAACSECGRRNHKLDCSKGRTL